MSDSNEMKVKFERIRIFRARNEYTKVQSLQDQKSTFQKFGSDF